MHNKMHIFSLSKEISTSVETYIHLCLFLYNTNKYKIQVEKEACCFPLLNLSLISTEDLILPKLSSGRLGAAFLLCNDRQKTIYLHIHGSLK